MLTVNATQVQKLQLRGPVGYTVVGNPTITDGVVSDFSSSNYLTVSTAFPQSVSFSGKVRAKVNTGNTGYSGIFKIENPNPPYQQFIIEGSYTDAVRLYHFDETTSSNVANVVYNLTLADVWVDYIFSYDINTKTLEITAKNVSTQATLFTKTYANTILNGGNVYFGYTFVGLKGSLDLNETYIKINDKLWFYQPAPTKYIVKDGKLVFADSGLYLKGPVNYAVSGSPTIVDDVASGLGLQTHLRLSTALDSANFSKLEVGFRVKSPVSLGNGWTPAIFVYSGSSPMCGIYTENGNSYFNIFGWDMWHCSISADTWYRVHYIYENGTVNITIYDDNDQVLDARTGTNTPSFSNAMLKFCQQYGSNIMQAIDFKKTYIKLDDQLWFYGKNYASATIAPVPSGYTYGTTTTSAIGWVDMRTQQFTAAPSGATIGRDE